MKILITGGAGFIGQRLALECLQRGRLHLDNTPSADIEKIVLADVAEPVFWHKGLDFSTTATMSFFTWHQLLAGMENRTLILHSKSIWMVRDICLKISEHRKTTHEWYSPARSQHSVATPCPILLVILPS